MISIRNGSVFWKNCQLAQEEQRGENGSDNASSSRSVNVHSTCSRKRIRDGTFYEVRKGVRQLGGTGSNLGSSNDNGASMAHCVESRSSPKLLESMRKLSNNLVKTLSNQISTALQKGSPSSEECKLVMENVVKSRRAIENDALLWQVIVIKENEMKWMEQKLSLARERPGHLEVSLQEKHRMRL